MRDVSYLHDEYAAKGVEFLAIHVFTDHEGARAYIAENPKLDYRWLFADEQALETLGVTGMPTQLILDREGRVAWRSSLGSFPSGADGIQEALDEVLR